MAKHVLCGFIAALLGIDGVVWLVFFVRNLPESMVTWLTVIAWRILVAGIRVALRKCLLELRVVPIDIVEEVDFIIGVHDCGAIEN